MRKKSVLALSLLGVGIICGNSCSDSSSCPSSSCVEGNEMCVGDTTFRCKKNVDGCLDLVEAPSACTPGDTRCGASGDQQTCVTDGCTWWGKSESCALGCDETTGRCRTNAACADSCTIGTTSCQGKNRMECKAQPDGCGAWVTAEVCPSSCDAQTGQCVSGCVANCNSLSTVSCQGKSRVECQVVDTCMQNVEIEQCPRYCEAGKCVTCPTACTANAYSCNGLVLQHCEKDENGCLVNRVVETCNTYCDALSGSCKSEAPECKLVNGSHATVVQWTDADTVWVWPKGDGGCKTKDANGKNIRWRLRIAGIDAPECSKAKNSFYYYTCTKDTTYTNTNERYGYEAWQWTETLLPFRSEIILTCDDVTSEGVCEFDNTSDDDADEDEQVYNRFLTYVGYSKNNASYDFSVEIAREGLAFSNTKFPSSKRQQICDSQKEAINAKKNIWSLGNSISDVLKKMSTTKQKGLSSMSSRCNY